MTTITLTTLILYAHPCSMKALKRFQSHLAKEKSLQGVPRPLVCPVAHGAWWITAGWDYDTRAKWEWGMYTVSNFGK